MSTVAIELTQSERNLIFQAVGRRVAAVVTNTHGNKLTAELGDLAKLPVLGAFVSLKRNGQLRSCMGCLAEKFPLADALENAATRAAKDDPRFPPITPHELLELVMEVWILWGMKKINVTAEERPNVIEIGKHGVILEKGHNRGLLLPGVAVEHNMTQLSFLEACAQKAGMRIDAWKDDNVEFSTFEGIPIPGHIYDVKINDPKTEIAMGHKGPLEMMIQPKTGPSKDDVARLLELTKNNFYLCSEGLTPTYFLPDIYDGDVSGVAISLQFPDRPLMVCTKMGVKNAIPLQASLIDLVQVIVQQVSRLGATNQERLDAQFDLTVFWDPQIHGSVKEHDLGKLDQFRRSLMIASNNGWVMQYSPDLPFSGVLEDAVDYLKVTDPVNTQLISFETMSTTQHVFASSVSKPILGTPHRQPAVAGAFYPSDVTVLNAELDRMLAPGAITADDDLTNNKPQKAPLHGANIPPGRDSSGGITLGTGGKKQGGKKQEGARHPSSTHKTMYATGIPTQFYAAAMVPHAGWIYSGRLAAQTLARVKFPSSAIIFVPKHRSGGPDWAVAPHRTWILPGQNVESDFALANDMVETVNLMQFDAVAHEQEHAIEVLLPIIARLSPQTKVVGVAMQSEQWDVIREEAIQFANLLQRLPQLPMLIISTDMNHYASEEATREVDKIALDAVQTLNPRTLLDVVLENRISMCGVTPAVFVLETLRQMNMLNECVPIGYTTSAQRSGDRSRVVGYAGILFK